MSTTIIKSRLRARFGIAAIAVVGLVVALAWAGCGGGESETESAASAPGSSLSAELQQIASLEFTTLRGLNESLGDVAEQASVVGSGEIVDLVRGYTVDLGPFADGGRDLDPFMLLVIEPGTLSAGADRLGSSGRVYVDLGAPPENDPESPLPSIGEIRAGIGAGIPVVFFLAESPPPVPPGDEVSTVLDEFAGRGRDDPLFSPAHPSALLGLDGAVAFPLLTGERLAESEANLDAAGDAGAEVSGFSAADAGLAVATP